MVLQMTNPQSIPHLSTNGTLILFLITMCPAKKFHLPQISDLVVTTWANSGQRGGSGNAGAGGPSRMSMSPLLQPTSCVKYGAMAGAVAAVL